MWVLINLAHFRLQMCFFGKGTHTNINMQTNIHKFGTISYNENEARKAENPVCLHNERQRDTYSIGLKKVT